MAEGEETDARQPPREPIKEEESDARQPARKPIKEEEGTVAYQPPTQSIKETNACQIPRNLIKEEEFIAYQPPNKSIKEEEMVAFQPPRKRTKEEDIVSCQITRNLIKEEEDIVSCQITRNLIKEEEEDSVARQATKSIEEEEIVARQPPRKRSKGGGGGGEEELDLVADLLASPFSRRTSDEKWALVSRGRPTPPLAGLSQQGKGYVRHFQASNYERYPWLTASERRCKLFCWECLLLAADRHGVWSCTGFANLSCLTKAATKHQSTAGHLHATVLLKTFGDAGGGLQPGEHACRETELHNQRVEKNREVLKRLMDCVVFLGKQELSFRGEDESPRPLNRGNYAELVSFLAEHDPDLHFQLTTNSAFAGSPDALRDRLAYAIAEVMMEEIKAEIKGAPFVAVVVEETTDARHAAQLALVLRYVTSAGVTERFVKFVDATSARRAEDLAELLFHFFEEYECCLDKVVAQCYHGAAALASGLEGLQAEVKQKAPVALFLHYHAHRLDLVLTQAASRLKECKLFFAHLNSIAAFLSRSPACTNLLEDTCKRLLPHVAPTRWEDPSRLVNAVHEKRVALKELFHHILEHPDEHDGDVLLCADGFSARLDDFEFVFLLSTFSGVFFGTLQTKSLDLQFCMERVNRLCDIVEQARGKFSEIYEQTVRITGGPSVQGDLRAHYQQLHTSVLDDILSQIRNRFQDHEKLTFLSLLDPQHFHTHGKKFPQAAFSSLTQSFGALFDLPRLKTELTVMYAMADDFEGKSPAELHDFLRRKNLSETLGQLHTLACLVLTLPGSTASDQPSFSAFKRIQTYARNTAGQMRLSPFASMSIEKDLLVELKRSGDLYNRAIDVFLREDRRMDLVFK